MRNKSQSQNAGPNPKRDGWPTWCLCWLRVQLPTLRRSSPSCRWKWQQYLHNKPHTTAQAPNWTVDADGRSPAQGRNRGTETITARSLLQLLINSHSFSFFSLFWRTENRSWHFPSRKIHPGSRSFRSETLVRQNTKIVSLKFNGKRWNARRTYFKFLSSPNTHREKWFCFNNVSYWILHKTERLH